MPADEHQFLEGRVRVIVGDLTEQTVDAIVNAANSTLLGGGGVDGAIHRRGGPAILAACQRLRATSWPKGLPTGDVALTEGGLLPAQYVIHTVGPIYGQHGGNEAALLAACYGNALSLAAGLKLRSLAFPAISTGVYGYPPDEAAVVVSTTLREQLPRHAVIEEVRLVFFDSRQLQAFIANQHF